MNSSIFGSSPPKFVFDLGITGNAFTATPATNLLFCSTYNVFNGQIVKVTSSGTLPAPLIANTYYHVINADPVNLTFKLSLTKGGSEIDITSAGSGTHSLITEMTVMLDYWVPLREEPDVRKSFQESELEADRFIISRGEYLEIEGRINLFKYPNDAARQSKFTQINQYKNKNVVFWKHRDGEAYKDINGAKVLFYIEHVIPKNLTTLDYRDVLYLKFVSLKEVVYPGWEIIPQIEEIIVDDSFVVNI
jgi:hypothetical protein